MENENKEQQEIITDEVVEETSVVEEQPTEEPSEAPQEEVTEEPKEEDIKEEVNEEKDTTSSENPSVENEIEEEEKTEENSEDTPSEEPSEEPDEEPSEEPSDAPADEDEAQEVVEESEPVPNEELEKVQRELAELREKEETRRLVEDIQTKAIEASQQFDDFADKLSRALDDTFKQYGIDTDKTIDEIKAIDPAKAAIAQELIGHAEAIRDAKIREFQAPIIEAQKNLVFREASKIMCGYEISDAQAQEAAKNLVDIINQVGLSDIEDDLKTKVEFAIARAKLNIKDEVKPEEKPEEKPAEEEEVKVEEEEHSETKEQVEEEPTEAPTEPPTEAPTEAPKVDLEAFKEGASTGDVVVNNNDDTTVDNVLEKLAKLPYREQIEFYKKNSELIKQASIKKYKRQGLK